MTLLLLASAGIMAGSGLLMAVLERAYHRDGGPTHLAAKPPRRVDDAELRRLFTVNSLLSVVLLLGVPALAFPWLFREGPVAPWRVAAEALGVLALYDLGYYAMHRAIHHKTVMRYVHRVHHLVRAPTARESMYVHPVEFVAGLVLLFLAVAALGGVHVVSYLVALVPFQLINVVIHCGLEFRSFPLRLLNRWSRDHHGHHGVDVNRNFGQFTLVWDRLFGTVLR